MDERENEPVRFRDEVEAAAWAGFMASAMQHMSSGAACAAAADEALLWFRARRGGPADATLICAARLPGALHREEPPR